MSSLPGFTLESFVAWNYDIVVEGQNDPNTSLQIAEALGTATQRRPRLTQEQFAKVVAIFEPHRERVEDRLGYFDEDCQSWRDYAGYSFDFIADETYDEGKRVLQE